MATKNTTKKPVTKVTENKNSTQAESSPVVAKEIDLHQYITVRNGFQGKLVYVSQKTGEHFTWDGFGSEQEMELIELRNAKNSKKKYFQNNWFMFDEDWVVDYLGLKHFYRHAVKIEDFDKIFKMAPNEIKKVVAGLSEGQKKSVAYRAKVLITNGEIDSNNAIKALEESLGVELIER